MTDRVEIWIVDRFEGECAVLERSLHETLTMPCFLLPGGLREGDALKVTIRADAGGSSLAFVRDDAETRLRAAGARRLLDQVKKTDPGGDIRL